MAIHFASYQETAKGTDRNPAPSKKGRLIALLGLASEAADLLAEYKKLLRDNQSFSRFRERARIELGDVLWYVSTTATHLGLDLEDIARENVRKTRLRFGVRGKTDSSTVPSLIGRYDSAFPAKERLPRLLAAQFVPKRGKPPRVLTYVNGRLFGDPLDDNVYTNDGYRFHDAIHLGFAVCLGWSPVVRGFLKRKRKSMREIDDNEDGARAQAIEEALAVQVHHYALDHDDLDGAATIDSEFLYDITRLVKYLEVSDVAPHEWERAILAAYSAFRAVREAHGGWIVGNLDRRTIRFAGPTLPARIRVALSKAEGAEKSPDPKRKVGGVSKLRRP